MGHKGYSEVIMKLGNVSHYIRHWHSSLKTFDEKRDVPPSLPSTSETATSSVCSIDVLREGEGKKFLKAPLTSPAPTPSMARRISSKGLVPPRLDVPINNGFYSPNLIDQIKILSEALNLVKVPSDKFIDYSAIIKNLTHCHFDDRFSILHHFLLGLYALKTKNYSLSVSSLKQVLSILPNHRSSLVYLFLATREGMIQIPLEERCQIREIAETTNFADNDVFARLSRLFIYHSIFERNDLKSELLQIVDRDPSFSLGWSALAAHCYYTMSEDESVARNQDDAQRYAIRALQLNKHNELAHSVLWNVSNGALGGFTARHPNPVLFQTDRPINMRPGILCNTQDLSSQLIVTYDALLEVDVDHLRPSLSLHLSDGDATSVP
jgi:tetratricopeptide (TPR) repeat protein